MMETATINPIFIKALVRCYLLKREARKRVFHNKCFYRQVLKVHKWRSQIKKRVETNNISSSSSSIRSTSSAGSNASTDDTQQPSSLRNESQADIDIVRRNLWLMIVRKDVIHAQRRKTHSREQKLIKSRAIAQKCMTHRKDFHKNHNNKRPPTRQE